MSTAIVKMPTLDNNVALGAILDSLSAHVVTLDRQGRVDYASRSWLNFARESGGDWVRIGPGADYLAVCRNASQQGELLAQKALEGIEAVLEGRLFRMSLEYPCHEPTGRQRWFLMNVDPMGEEHGGVVISHIDITERKQMEGALADREAKFRGIYESNMVPVAFWNLEGFITDANDAYLKLTGVTRAELDDHKLRCKELTRTDQLHLDKQAIQEAITKGVCTSYEKVYVRRDGRPVPVLIGGVMLPGMHDSGVVLAIDLRERKKAEEALRSEEKSRYSTDLARPLIIQNKGVSTSTIAIPKLCCASEQFIRKNMRECCRRNWPSSLVDSPSCTRVNPSFTVFSAYRWKHEIMKRHGAAVTTRY
jgi:PAS domain S-box-containing protein